MGSPIGLIGIVVLLLIAWGLSTDRRRVPWRIIVGGVGLQFVGAVLLLKTPVVVGLFDWFSRGVSRVIGFADEGIEFIFGPQLMDPTGPWGFVFGIRVLPVIIFFASLMAVLYHLGLMQRIIAALAWVLRGTLGVTGTEAMAMAANVFVGQTEAPLCVKPYIERMTRSQLMTLMVGGFATIAGSVLAGYANFLYPIPPESAGAVVVAAAQEAQAQWIKHLLTASILSAPAAFVMAKILVPETEQPVDEDLSSFELETPSANVLDAAAHGATDGMKLALNVAAMLIAFVALLALLNWPIEEIGRIGFIDTWLTERGHEELSIQLILGAILSPLAMSMGIPKGEAVFVGSLLAEKVLATEFIAFRSLSLAVNDPEGARISARSAQISAYALCGFANFGSIGIQIGGLSVLAPGRRREFVTLAFRAMVGGALASWMTASIAGLFIEF